MLRWHVNQGAMAPCVAGYTRPLRRAPTDGRKPRQAKGHPPADVREPRGPDTVVARLVSRALSDSFASVHRHPERKRASTGHEGEAMTVIDLQDQREARRRAEFEEWCASQERALAEARRMADELMPAIEQLLEYKKKQRANPPHGPVCEAPCCRDTVTTLHAIPGGTPEDLQALIALCDGHLCAVRSGGVRVSANSDDTLTWRFCPVGAAPVQLTGPRKRGRRSAKTR